MEDRSHGVKSRSLIWVEGKKSLIQILRGKKSWGKKSWGKKSRAKKSRGKKSYTLAMVTSWLLFHASFKGHPTFVLFWESALLSVIFSVPAFSVELKKKRKVLKWWLWEVVVCQLFEYLSVNSGMFILFRFVPGRLVPFTFM